AIAAAAAETLGVDRVNIWQLSPDGSEIQCRESYHRFMGPHVKGYVLKTASHRQYFSALQTGRIIDAADVTTDPRTRALAVAWWQPQGVHAVIEVPIHAQGQVLGVVCHEYMHGPRHWHADEVSFATQIADLVAQAYLNADLRRRAQELSAITRVSREITSVPDLQAVFHSIARHAAELSRTDASGVFAFRENGQLYIAAGYGVSDAFMKAIDKLDIAPGQGAIGKAAEARVPVQISDIEIDAHYEFRRLAELERIRAILAVPMLREDDVIGGIVLWHHQPRYFAPQEVTFIQALAQQCINAVENARLFEAEARRRREAETLSAVTQALSTSLDLHRVLELILSQLQQVVPYDSASVQQLKGNWLEVVGGRGFPNIEELLGVRFALDSPIHPNVKIIRTREPYILEDAPQHYAAFNEPPHADAHIRAWMGVPLIFGDRIIGMIALDKKEPGFYTSEHARLAGAFAAQAAIALENARIFAQEEQRAQELARALEQQKELDRLKDQFIQNVSHELRTPIAIARGYAEWLELGELGPLQPEQEEPITIIARRMRMLSSLVDDINAILEVETQEPRCEPVHFDELAHALLSDFRAAANRAGLTLEEEIAPELPPIMGDVTHFRRLLDNLLGNALKFTAEGGEISLRLYQQEDWLVLQVTDTGIGIPEDKLARIFDRFYQVDGSMSRRYGGTGLGLALVKGIVNAHQGVIDVKSKLGAGSTFTVKLPLAGPASE
ncbi:MAG TPA: GAF domain-containing protein, partial [Chloroflexi bacterium]|nr:GAF domain-containing protein [Chloroflexota bacterium]